MYGVTTLSIRGRLVVDCLPLPLPFPQKNRLRDVDPDADHVDPSRDDNAAA